MEELARMLGASKGVEAAKEHVRRLMEMPALRRCLIDSKSDDT